MTDPCAKPGLMPVEQAIEQLLNAAIPVTEVIELPLAEALGCVLAQDQVSPVAVPPADNSAMDGYAFNSSGLNSDEAITLPLSQRIPAGTAPQPLVEGTVARIFTGAEVPMGATTVEMQENCAEQTDGAGKTQVTIAAGFSQGSNIRPKGQDIQQGSVVLAKGHRLKPQDMGLLASIGIATVKVFKPLTIAVLSTGDELIEPGNALAGGQIYNSNRYTLAGLIKAMGWQLLDLGIVADTPEATEQALLKASKADCIITSGGVSVGEEDHVKAAVEKLGSLNLWKLAIKPGKPFAFGEVQGTPFLGLPGNPAAVLVTFLIVARPYLLKTQGASKLHSLHIPAIAGFSKSRPAKRQEYLRAELLIEDGKAIAKLTGNQSSGVLSTASLGNGLVIHKLNQTIQEGEQVEFVLFDSVIF